MTQNAQLAVIPDIAGESFRQSGQPVSFVNFRMIGL